MRRSEPKHTLIFFTRNSNIAKRVFFVIVVANVSQHWSSVKKDIVSNKSSFGSIYHEKNGGWDSKTVCRRCVFKSPVSYLSVSKIHRKYYIQKATNIIFAAF